MESVYVDRFNGSDYSRWKFKIELLLDNNNLLYIILLFKIGPVVSIKFVARSW